eukprot:1149430-Pelagomonas_calceolata.AAC.8
MGTSGAKGSTDESSLCGMQGSCMPFMIPNDGLVHALIGNPNDGLVHALIRDPNDGLVHALIGNTNDAG